MKLEQPLAQYGNPQKENGYTPIANELLEQIMSFDFSKRQLLVLLAISRMTYGYSKKSDALSGWQIAKLTKLDRSSVSKTINELLELNVITKLDTGRVSHGVLVNEIAINKLYKDWLTVDKTSTVDKSSTVDKTSTVTVDKTSTQPLIKRPTHKAIKTIKQNIDGFDDFWAAYPKKVDKKKSLIAWNKSKPKTEDVLAALVWQIKSKTWIDGFIPNPTTYINGERWNDEPPFKNPTPNNPADFLNGAKVI